MTDNRDGPVLIELEDIGPSPADAAPIVDPGAPPVGQAMQTAATLAARRPSRLVAWFWRLLLAVIVFFASVSAWDFVTGLVARNTYLGWAAMGLVGLFVLVCLAIIIREWAALARLARIEHLHEEAKRVVGAGDLDAARNLTDRLSALYVGREDTSWGRARLKERRGDLYDADALVQLAEDTLLVPLDDQARREVEAAARQVATVTALVPLALADVLTALTANVRMIRRVAEIYGGRSGTIGSWRLVRVVMAHLVTTGAVSIGDDLLGSIGGGHLLSKLSRRFGEGLVNGALTARVGVAAMEICRPLPFSDERRPSIRSIIGGALSGLFARDEAAN